MKFYFLKSPFYSALCFLGLMLTACQTEQAEPSNTTADPEVTKTQHIERLCDFSQGACQQQIDDLVISFQLSPSFAPSEQPIATTLTTNLPIQDLSISLIGRDMYMGQIPMRMQQQSATHFQGQVIYGSCATDYMVWRAQVKFRQNQQHYLLWFDFRADAPHTSKANEKKI